MVDRSSESEGMNVDFETMRSVALVGSALVVITLFLFGTVLPPWLEWNVETASLNSGIALTVLLYSNFVASYTLPPFTKKKVTFVIYWFMASLIFNLVWQVPMWTTSLSSVIYSTEIDLHRLQWAIVWHSYGAADSAYRDLTPEIVGFEIWYLMGNMVGLVGLIHFFFGNKNKSMVFFIVCGVLQSYNTTLLLFLCWFEHSMSPITKDARAFVIYLGLNGLWACASLIATRFSCVMLLDSLSRNSAPTVGERQPLLRPKK